MEFNFTDLKPMAGGTPVLDTCIRVTKSSITLGSKVLSSRRKGDKISVRIDVPNQAIFLMADDNGYIVQGDSEDSGRWISAGARVQKLGLRRGDYKPVEGHQGVFVRAMGLDSGQA